MAHRCEKFSVMAPAFRPTKMPRTISPTSDKVFALVKIFWMSLPKTYSLRIQKREQGGSSVRRRVAELERLIANFEPKPIGAMTQLLGEMAGNKTPR